MFSAIEIFDLAIKIEENGERFYRNALSGVSDNCLHALFEWLADEEMRHKEWFLLHRENCTREDIEPSLQEAGSALLTGIVGDQSFSLKEADLSKIHHVEELIALAIEFEKDTIIFFEMIQSVLSDPETLKHLAEIIQEEQGHIQLLDEYERKQKP